MKTLTITTARQNLGQWLKKAAGGESIGIVVGAQIVALRPVPIEATDYMETEYGLTPEEADRAARRIRAESAAAHRRGEFVEVTGGNLAQLVAARRKGTRAGSHRGAA
jgi:antitoxin (DNA-binding transcriptional repressor) of toxin-antitoxin stability system